MCTGYPVMMVMVMIVALITEMQAMVLIAGMSVLDMVCVACMTSCIEIMK